MEEKDKENIVEEVALALHLLILQPIKDYMTSLVSGLPKEKILEIEKEAERYAKELSESLAKAEVNSIEAVIEEGVKNGKTREQIEQDIENTKGLNKNDTMAVLLASSYFTNDRQARVFIERLAEKLRTSRVDAITSDESWKNLSNIRHKFAEWKGAAKKMWHTQGDDRVCEICNGNEGEGFIPVDDLFSSGDLYPPSHPQCRCIIRYESEQAKEYGRQFIPESSEIYIPNQNRPNK